TTALHIEIAFRNVVVLSLENLLESFHGTFHRHLLAFAARKNLRNAKRLAQETLNLPRAKYRHLVFAWQFIHSKNGNDVLQIFVTLKHPLHSTSNFVVLLPHGFGRKRTRG